MLVGETYCTSCKHDTETLETTNEFLCVECGEEK
jgi:predicted RNA-binding Zn-ribbon protein involved in translation (DUF1610 family)